MQTTTTSHTRRWLQRVRLAQGAALLACSAFLVFSLGVPEAMAQSVQSAPAGVKSFENSMAQRMLACAACHGAQGRAAPDGYYPRIAGKPAGYLYNQLLNFRDGRRHYGLMTRLVDPLTDEYLWEIAQYFAALDLPYPPPQPLPASPAQIQRGAELAQRGDAALGVPACAACHGTRLTGVVPNIPGLLGVPRDYINSQLGSWKARERKAHAPDCMAQIVERMKPDDISAVSAWLSAQPLPADPHPAPAMAQPVPMACGSAAMPTPAGAKPAGVKGARP